MFKEKLIYGTFFWSITTFSTSFSMYDRIELMSFGFENSFYKDAAKVGLRIENQAGNFNLLYDDDELWNTLQVCETKSWMSKLKQFIIDKYLCPQYVQKIGIKSQLRLSLSLSERFITKIVLSGSLRKVDLQNGINAIFSLQNCSHQLVTDRCFLIVTNEGLMHRYNATTNQIEDLCEMKVACEEILHYKNGHTLIIKEPFKKKSLMLYDYYNHVWKSLLLPIGDIFYDFTEISIGENDYLVILVQGNKLLFYSLQDNVFSDELIPQFKQCLSIECDEDDERCSFSYSGQSFKYVHDYSLLKDSIVGIDCIDAENILLLSCQSEKRHLYCCFLDDFEDVLRVEKTLCIPGKTIDVCCLSHDLCAITYVQDFSGPTFSDCYRKNMCRIMPFKDLFYLKQEEPLCDIDLGNGFFKNGSVKNIREPYVVLPSGIYHSLSGEKIYSVDDSLAAVKAVSCSDDGSCVIFASHDEMSVMSLDYRHDENFPYDQLASLSIVQLICFTYLAYMNKCAYCSNDFWWSVYESLPHKFQDFFVNNIGWCKKCKTTSALSNFYSHISLYGREYGDIYNTIEMDNLDGNSSEDS